MRRGGWRRRRRGRRRRLQYRQVRRPRRGRRRRRRGCGGRNRATSKPFQRPWDRVSVLVPYRKPWPTGWCGKNRSAGGNA
ncbi:hypothetical protein CYJ45_06195 [Corynebacterium coyleae]|nr:hypothetical protein CYJ45_06195 [Corynebacterium coyleae]